MNGRVLAVDPGDKRIGIALSDENSIIANPLLVIEHTSRLTDAAAIAGLASDHAARLIVIGQPLDDEGQVGPQGRKSARLAEAVRTQTETPVVLWDETGSTQTARAARLALGARRSRRRGHMDDLAAVVILQSFLDSMDGK